MVTITISLEDYDLEAAKSLSETIEEIVLDKYDPPLRYVVSVLEEPKPGFILPDADRPA